MSKATIALATSINLSTPPDRADCCAELITLRGELNAARARNIMLEAKLDESERLFAALVKRLDAALNPPPAPLTLTDRGDAADGYHAEVEP